MDNISFPKKMEGYYQKELPTEKENNAILCEEPFVEEINFERTLNYASLLIEQAASELELCYLVKARKELHDARIHLAMVKNILKNVK